LRAWLAAVVVAVVALAAVACDLPAARVEPHENPDTAPIVFAGISQLQAYSGALNFVSEMDATGVEVLRDQASRGNIPAALRQIMADFLSSGQALATLISWIEADLESSRTLVSQFRPAEAAQSSAAAAQKLSKAYAELWVMETRFQEVGRQLQVDSMGEGSPLRQAYEEVEAKLLRPRSQLDLLTDMHRSLTEQTELQTEMFRPTTITLVIQPLTAFVGDTVEFQGTLSADGDPLVGRKVTVLLNGSPAAAVFTDGGGAYRGRLVLPYEYISEMTVQPLYYPEGADAGVYLGTFPTRVSLLVSSFPTVVSLQVPEGAYPGRNLVLQGSFDYGGKPAPASRSLRIYWDSEPVTEESVPADFTLELLPTEEASLGKHRVTVHVLPHQRYAPAWVSFEVELTQATPVIEVDAPGVVVLPLALDIRGKVYSTLGPLQDAPVRIALGDWAVTTRSRGDGTFGARLSTGMNLTVAGPQELRVSVTPEEPSHKATSLATDVVVINPAGMAGLALALSIPVFLGASRLRRRRAGPGAVTPGPRPAPAAVRTESPPPRGGILEPEVGGGPPAVLLAVYRGVLRLVQRATAVALRPRHTLREFAQECTPGLGPLAGYFQEFTLMIERLLYSRHRPGEGEAAHGRELSQRLKEGLRDEDT
jgi:hypothetical protein